MIALKKQLNVYHYSKEASTKTWKSSSLQSIYCKIKQPSQYGTNHFLGLFCAWDVGPMWHNATVLQYTKPPMTVEAVMSTTRG